MTTTVKKTVTLAVTLRMTVKESGPGESESDSMCERHADRQTE